MNRIRENITNIMRTRPLIIAHRGNSSEAPQNSRIAFQQAIDLGVDVIELDVNKTQDGFPVIFHGPSLKETAQIDGFIHDLTLAEARQLDIGSWKGKRYAGERIMTLPEVLEFAKDRVRLAIDLKTEEIIPAIVRCIQEADMVDDVVICGCYVSTAQKVWACDNRLTIVLNMDSAMGKLAKQEDKPAFYRAYIQQAAYNHLSALNVNYQYVTSELVRLAHFRAIPVWTWTVDRPDDMRRLIQLGVDAIYTNYPKRLLGVLDEG